MGGNRVEGYTAIRSFKTPSSPPDFAEAVKTGLTQLMTEHDLGRGENVIIVHGTTVSTNAVIERTGPPLALFTTAGFRDLLDLQRLRLEDPLNLFTQRPRSLIPRERVFAIEERLAADGTVLLPLDRAGVIAAAHAAIEAGATAIVVCLLHSTRNPAHEHAVRETIRAAGIAIDVVLSSEVWAQQGEYERAVAAVLNAYVKQTISTYISDLQTFLAQTLPAARLLITRSNGGLMSAQEACGFPVHTLLSGPAAGVTAACFLGDLLGTDRLLTMDMGGTSTDLSLIWDGRASTASQAMVGDFPLMMPVTGIEAIGAGGGSIAFMDGTVLAVGPRSAGASPGPACYGRGGTSPTLSDAYLLCGLLDPERFLGGRMILRRDLAATAMAPLAKTLGRDIEAAAEACIAVSTSNMSASVLPYLARVGVDPQLLTLLLYGGAGAIHGPLLAEELGIGTVIIPRTPSVFCALGGVVSDLVHDVISSTRGLSLDMTALREKFAVLEADARAWLAAQLEPALLHAIAITHSAEMRYRGQFFVIDTVLPPAALAAGDIAALDAAFHDEHQRIYNHRSATAVEIVALRVRITGRLPTPEAIPLAPATTKVDAARLATRTIRLHGARHDAPVYDRTRLAPGHRMTGPAIVEQADATILIPEKFAAEIGPLGDIFLTRH